MAIKPLLSVLIIIYLKSAAAQLETSGNYIKGSIDVARCRASCGDKFLPTAVRTDSSCTGSPDCNMCWQTCGYLFDNYFLWVDMCNDHIICLPGCRQACDFWDKTDSPGFPSSTQLDLDVYPIRDFVMFQWSTKVSNDIVDQHVVYVLRTFNQQRSEWIILAQTFDTSCTIQKHYINEENRHQLVAVTRSRVVSLTDVEIDLSTKTTTESLLDTNTTRPPTSASVSDAGPDQLVMPAVFSTLTLVCVGCCAVVALLLCHRRRQHQRKLRRLTSLRSSLNHSRKSSSSRELSINSQYLVRADSILDTSYGFSVSTGFYSSTPVYIKALTGTEAPSETKQDLLLQMSKFSHLGKHPGFLSIVGLSRQAEATILLMERMLAFVTLRTYLMECYNHGEKVHQELHAFVPCGTNKLKTSLTADDLLGMMLIAASTMETLSELGYIHKKLNASHIIIDPATKDLKLVDPELVTDYHLGTDDSLAYFCAPETLRDQTTTHRSDVWSFGCLVWQIVRFGDVPLKHILLT